MEGLSIIELGVLLKRDAAASSSSQRGPVQDALYVQVVIPGQLTEEEHQQVDTLTRYAKQQEKQGQSRADVTAAKGKGRGQDRPAKKGKGKEKGKGKQAETEPTVDLRKRVERRFLSSKVLLPVIEESTGCRYL